MPSKEHLSFGRKVRDTAEKALERVRPVEYDMSRCLIVEPPPFNPRLPGTRVDELVRSYGDFADILQAGRDRLERSTVLNQIVTSGLKAVSDAQHPRFGNNMPGLAVAFGPLEKTAAARALKVISGQDSIQIARMHLRDMLQSPSGGVAMLELLPEAEKLPRDEIGELFRGIRQSNPDVTLIAELPTCLLLGGDHGEVDNLVRAFEPQPPLEDYLTPDVDPYARELLSAITDYSTLIKVTKLKTDVAFLGLLALSNERKREIKEAKILPRDALLAETTGEGFAIQASSPEQVKDYLGNRLPICWTSTLLELHQGVKIVPLEPDGGYSKEVLIAAGVAGALAVGAGYFLHQRNKR